MKPEAQRIAIAEACGWTKICEADYCAAYGNPYEGPVLQYWEGLSPDGEKEALPDYLTDLNAMHEAEKVLTDEQWNAYTDILFNLVPDVPLTMRMGPAMRYFIHATAAQRAEAFLRTIGKWEESE